MKFINVRLLRDGMPRHSSGMLLLALALLGARTPAEGQEANGAPTAAGEAEEEQEEVGDATLDIYGFAMTDAGFQFHTNDPNWFDVLRPTKLPAFEDEFGEDGHTFFGVRQSRLGVESYIPTRLDTIHTIFEFELFGVGVDQGQTTFRLRHAYGEIGQFGAGQYWSPFMDIDVFPNSIEYWGPPGMVFFRNVQLRWMPVRGDSRVTVALERPGASGDQGRFDDRVELDDIRGRFPLPDLSAEGRLGTSWGYVELAGILRYVSWDDFVDDDFDFSGDGVGWGLNLSSNVGIEEHVLRLQGVYGVGIANYMNDATADVGPRINFDDPVRPLEGELLPVLGLVAFLDLNWSERLTSTIGYSLIDIDNSDGQSDLAFSRGDYALANVLFHPVEEFFVGPEIQYGRRKNFGDNFSSDDIRLQISAKYNFRYHLGGDDADE